MTQLEGRLAEWVLGDDERTAWKPQFFDLGTEHDRAALDELLDRGRVRSVHDFLELQLEDLAHIRYPSAKGAERAVSSMTAGFPVSGGLPRGYRSGAVSWVTTTFPGFGGPPSGLPERGRLLGDRCGSRCSWSGRPMSEGRAMLGSIVAAGWSRNPACRGTHTLSMAFISSKARRVRSR